VAGGEIATTADYVNLAINTPTARQNMGRSDTK